MDAAAWEGCVCLESPTAHHQTGGQLIRSPGALAQPSVQFLPVALAVIASHYTLLNSKVIQRGGVAHKIDFKVVFILDLVFCDQHMHLELLFFFFPCDFLVSCGACGEWSEENMQVSTS